MSKKLIGRGALAGTSALMLLTAACMQLTPPAPQLPGVGLDQARQGPPVEVVAPPAPPAIPPGRQAATVRIGPIAELFPITGEVAGADELGVSFSFAGRVETIAVKPGQQVEEGQLLIEADSKQIVKDLD